MENTVISPERAKGIVSLKSPFAPPGLVVIVIYDRGLMPPAIFFQPFRPHIESTLNSYLRQGIWHCGVNKKKDEFYIIIITDDFFPPDGAPVLRRATLQGNDYYQE